MSINAKLAGVDKCDCIVIGAGVVGLSVARRLALAGREVIIIESESIIGSGVSSRNSGVIHAGIYYPNDSLKARLCVTGKHQLYDFCAEHGVAHARVGKVLVATEEDQLETLQRYLQLGRLNGVDDLEWMTSQEVTALEPQVRCAAGVWSPSTGIIDVHDYMLALLGDAERAGAMLALNAPFVGARIDQSVIVEIGGRDPFTVETDLLVNCAGLNAPKLAGQMTGLPAKFVPAGYFAKGNYFYLQQKSPFHHLIYPMPSGGGLGVHSSFDLAGRCRFGPDIHWVETPDYDVDDKNLPQFYEAIRRYWPALPTGALAPDYTGIRPKLTRPGEPAADFCIQSARQHGFECLINLFGIESPGLTSSLAIADYVHELAVRSGH